MSRGLPALFATRSGKDLGKKVATELSHLMRNRLHTITDARSTAKLVEERERIEQIREMNREFFGDEWGEFRLRHLSVENFSDGEIHVTVPNYRLIEGGPEVSNSVRGQDVFLIHSPYEPQLSVDELLDGLPKKMDHVRVADILQKVRGERSPPENLVEGFIVAYTLGRWAEKITLVQPNHPYARQDHSRDREAAIAKLIAKIHETSRVEHGIFVDLHSNQISEFYDNNADNLRSSGMILDAICGVIGYTEERKDEYVVVSPDAGGTSTARYHAKKLGTEVGIGDKRRDYSQHNTVEKTVIIGDVEDKIAIIIDDMIDTAGTMCSIVEECISRGAREVYLACTHPIMSGPAIERLDKLYKEGKLKQVLVTNSISRGPSFSNDHPWYHEIGLEKMLASAIYQLTMEGSVANVYHNDSKAPVVNFD